MMMSNEWWEPQVYQRVSSACNFISKLSGTWKLLTPHDGMKIHHIIAVSVILTQASAASNTTDLNGWFPCSDFTFSDEGSSHQDAECAVYNAPLCYPGICEAPESANPKVDIFVKRLPATASDPKTASNVWLLQGGPGFSSTPMETDMVTLHSQLEGAVNVYTMDHRGTGRSTRLDCVAAQVTTTGSPFGNEIDSSEVAACAEDLQNKYGDLASFSVTTAATDVATFISKFTNGASTIVYGVSYGTVLVERLMHLAPLEVTGYALDGVATTSGASANEFPYISKWDIDFGEVGDAFLALCEEENSCKPRFESSGLNRTLQSLLHQVDAEPTSTCAEIFNSTNTQLGDGPPSFGLRFALGTLLKDSYLRTLIPPVVYRVARCAPEDVDVLNYCVINLISTAAPQSQDNAFASTLLYNLIVFSEMWESPTPSISELKARFEDTRICDQGAYAMTSLYCAFSKEKSATCEKLGVGTYDTHGIVYERDQYWNKTVAIPPHASVLLLSGKLDPQTPHKYAEYMLDVLDGEKKELVTFDYASHGTVMTTQMVAGDPWSETCGMKVLASYVRNGGDLAKLDTSCVETMPAFNLTTPEMYLNSYLGTNDAYDGLYNETLNPYYKYSS